MKYSTVNTKHGKAIIADTQTALQEMSDMIGGDVVILCRLDGEDSFDELGIIDLPYKFGGRNATAEEMYGTDTPAYYISNRSDYYWTLKDEDAKKDIRVIKEIMTLKEGDMMLLRFVNGQQLFDTFRKEQTNWHDTDTTEYQLAVVLQ